MRPCDRGGGAAIAGRMQRDQDALRQAAAAVLRAVRQHGRLHIVDGRPLQVMLRGVLKRNRKRQHLRACRVDSPHKLSWTVSCSILIQWPHAAHHISPLLKRLGHLGSSEQTSKTGGGRDALLHR